MDEDPHPLLRPWPLPRRQMGWIAVTLAVVGSCITVFGTYYASMWLKAGKFHNYFYDYLTPNAGMAIIGWFLTAKIYWNKSPLKAFEKEFAAASFGIYLVHVLVMDWWAQCGYWFGSAVSWKSVPIVVGLVAITSFVVVKFIKALPGGENIT